jgi:hypothetical protein
VTFRIPAERIAHETVDGEVVILDQVSGLYFSLTGAGADIWALVDAGVGVEAMAPALAQRYDVDAERARAAVAALVEALAGEQLIEAIAAAPRPAPDGDGTRRAWVEPLLQKFSELQTLLILDPIHDVDETGWPRTPPRPA